MQFTKGANNPADPEPSPQISRNANDNITITGQRHHCNNMTALETDTSLMLLLWKSCCRVWGCNGWIAARLPLDCHRIATGSLGLSLQPGCAFKCLHAP